tara:strand:- start:466 stop:846 length:381 start_codon:yes stop_codon:yes gene_type:complete
LSDNKSPGFQRKPDYPLEIAPSGKSVRVTLGGEVIAETSHALVMTESDYSPAYYIPLGDVRLDLMEKTNHSSHCPFKGNASYWTINAGGQTAENAVWSYEMPFDEVALIRETMSFYTSKVDAIVVD